jgi:hypothetical protein
MLDWVQTLARNALPVVNVSGFHIRDQINTATVGVNYRF